MTHPLICSKCGKFRDIEFKDYRGIEFKGVRFESDDGKKGFGVEMPFFECKSCGLIESILPKERYLKFKDDILPSINDGEFFDMPLKFIFSKIDPDLKFKHYDHLEFTYDSRDYYLIPGLRREWDDGYLTPVFFDKDVLLYYNNHPDYTVKLTSFSSGNIYQKGKPIFSHGFGISRKGKIFMWLGDLDEDFDGEDMKPHLKRFQASNIPSDHDIISKFYLSQNPFSPSDAFQTSDNESRLFNLYNDFNSSMKDQYGLEFTKVEIGQLADYYKPPILDEKEQIFGAYLSLNKYFVENIQDDNLRKILLKNGKTEKDFESNGRKLGSLKLFTIYIRDVLKKENADLVISPLFVLNDLRQLHGHLSGASFQERYESCKERLGIKDSKSDMEVFKTLVTKMISLFIGITIGDSEKETR